MSFASKIIRCKFTTTTRNGASKRIRREADLSIAIAESVLPEDGRRPARVPAMMGVDEDMRNWSLFQVLEHNTIVNRQITMTIRRLVAGEPIPEGEFDPKKDVMPSDAPGNDTLSIFQDSIDEHLQFIAQAPKLRGTATHNHPIFGPFDAHRWHCMVGFHLQVHRRQMEAIRAAL